jgi:peptide/nickel transport system ATP-binding protein
MDNVLEARDLAVGANIDGALLPALRDVSFRLAPGRILGVVGESGAGKSMIGRAIAHLLPPGFAITAGSLEFEGRDLTDMRVRDRRALLGRAIAFIPQGPLSALNPMATIGRQFNEHLARQHIRRRAGRRERALAMLAAAQLSNGSQVLELYPHQLSGGMCQRVLIAMAFASHPRLIVADEPTTALDVTIQMRIVELIAQMQRQHGTALIFITHDLRLAAHICDDIMVMYAGRAIEFGPARTVLSAPAHPYTRCLQLANPATAAPGAALYLLPEQMPSLRELTRISGCHFAPRCPVATRRCRLGEPPNIMTGARHWAACIRSEVAAKIEAPLELPVATAGAVASAPLLEVQRLQKRYITLRPMLGSATEITAVSNATFGIEPAELVGLVGESGSGKSTLARLLLGLEQPSAGRILLHGKDLTECSARSRRLRVANIQMVFQDPQSALNPRRRIAGIVTQAMEAGSLRAPWEERLERARVLLADMGLAADFATRYPAHLSGGQRQRVNIARALCKLPKILVADEIVSGLDVSVQAQLLYLLLRLRDEFHFAMLFISHDLTVVRHLCSRVLVMYRGEIVEQGPAESVFAQPQHPHTRALLAAVATDGSNINRKSGKR